MTFNGWTVDFALRKLRETAEKIGHEPHTTDMGGNVGAYCRLFGSWENAKEVAGVKGYVAPEKPKPPIPVRTYKYALAPEELAEEKRLYEEREKRRRAGEPEHVKRPFVLTSHIGRGLKKLREDEYLPPRDAILVAQSTKR